MRRAQAAISLLAALALFGAAPTQAAAPAFSAPALFDLLPHKPQPSLVFAYDGFQVDASGARRTQSPEKTVLAVKAQIDLVERVRLKPDILAFMRTVPIKADPTKTGDPVRYAAGQGVLLKVKRLEPKKALLLAGLLEAYHDQKLNAVPAGADVNRFLVQAQTAHKWPKSAMMLQSDADYFGLTASTYLWGASTREPYSRQKLRQTQPDYYRWLAQMFDDGHARG